MEQFTYKVYVRTDDQGNIIAPPNSSAFLADPTGWTQIDEGMGDRYHHAQGNYLDKPIMTDSGIYRYRLVDGVVAGKTEAEIAAEEANTVTPPTAEDLTLDLLAEHEERLCMLELTK